MMKPQRLLALCIIFLPLFSTAQQLGGNPSSIKWKQFNNTTTRVIFPAGLDSQANRIFNINRLLANNTANTIGGRQRKWNIVLLNQTTSPNAYVRLAPVMSELYMTPGQDNFSTGSIRWDDNLIIHENRHMQQFSNFNNGLTKVFGFFLGQEGQLLANGISIPDYFFEGDAVWQETLVSAQGRGRMPSFYNSVRSLWLANKDYSWMKLRSGSYRHFTPDHYETGYQLVAYGYQKYGSDFWQKVTNDAVRFKGLFYSFNKTIEKYSGESYPVFRKNALDYFKKQNITDSATTTPLHYITSLQKNNVTDYQYPVFINEDSLLVTKKSYREINSFYVLADGKKKRIRIKDIVIDDYYSYRNGWITYAVYKPDIRWTNRAYNIIKLLNIYTNETRTLTKKGRYFSPDINADATEVLPVKVNEDGSNHLQRLSATDGSLIKELPNGNNYFFTQTKYIDSVSAVSAVRNPEGKMCLATINLQTGETERLTPLSFNVVGYPFVKQDSVYFTAMNKDADKIYVVSLKDKKVFQVTNNITGVYHPAVNHAGKTIVSVFTADGYQLAEVDRSNLLKAAADSDFTNTPDLYTTEALRTKGAGILYTLNDTTHQATTYHKTAGLFNFHSWRPEVNDPEYSYHLYGNNVLSTLSSTLSYTYNRSDQSHKVSAYETYAGLFPIFSAGAEYHFNRSIDTAVGKTLDYNSAKLNLTMYIPLSWANGRNYTSLTFGSGYNIEQLAYRGIGKNVFNNESVKYVNPFISFSHISRQAKQHINPRWAQAFSLSYRKAFNLVTSHKFVGNSSFYFPGFFVNHSIVINASYQKRDSFADYFSRTFSYSRGYDALSTRRMYKAGFNYHLPLFYPDWGIGNIIFFQRVRANLFYDHTVAKARLNGVLTDLKNRSTGTEIYFDTKLWNELPVSFGVRYSNLLDTDYQHPGMKNRWEFIVPINLIPD